LTFYETVKIDELALRRREGVCPASNFIRTDGRNMTVQKRAQTLFDDP
jgi:hypothetical protein